jgi:hypothetical protein
MFRVPTARILASEKSIVLARRMALQCEGRSSDMYIGIGTLVVIILMVLIVRALL